MSNKQVNAIVGQSGGPTAAINATLAGVIRGCREANLDGKIDRLFGMRNGIEGLLSENLTDLTYTFFDEVLLEGLALTPSSALGSCRKRLKPACEDRETYEKILQVLKKNDIRYFFYIGGNDSMDTVLKLSDYARGEDYELYVIGVPKTVDNDLCMTDHTPGFGSSAKYIATSVKEMLRDISVYTVPAVTIVEIMGRDAGWLTAASALPALSGGIAPDLVYLPERSFDTDAFIGSVKEALARHPSVMVCVSEGIKFKNGEYVGAGSQSGATDAFGHKYLQGTARVLEGIVREKIGCKVRAVELNLPQRCAAHIASATDIGESVGVGRAAVGFALARNTGVMTTINRHDEENYSVYFSVADIIKIANGIKEVPDSFINASGNGVTDECLKYLAPLILGEVYPEYDGGMPRHIIL